MKKIIFSLLFILLSLYISAQKQYTVKGETLNLRIELEGDLDFLSYKTKDNYRFFIKDKNETIYELLNTRQEDNSYLNEYKRVLSNLTQGSNMSTEKVGFGHYSLKQFIRAYNSSGTKRYTYTGEKVYMQSRLGVFGGITNHPFTENKNNAKVPSLAVEFEFFAKISKPRQTGYFSIEHTFENSKIKYTSTQLALGYRYRFINKSAFNIYGNLQISTYTFSKNTFVLADNSKEVVNDAIFHIPLSFGLGSDIKINNHSLVTLTYKNLFAIFENNSANFPIDFAVGYKVNL